MLIQIQACEHNVKVWIRSGINEIEFGFMPILSKDQKYEYLLSAISCLSKDSGMAGLC